MRPYHNVINGLHALCEKGAKAVANNEYDELRFNLWNKEEADIVKAYMLEKHPNIPFRIKRCC